MEPVAYGMTGSLGLICGILYFMKILYTNFHQRNGGGHASYVANLAKSLAPNNQVFVATPGTSRLFKQVSQLEGVKSLDMRYDTRVSSMIPQVLGLRRLFENERFDLIHTNGSVDHRCAMLARLGLRHQPAIVWTKHNTAQIKSFGQAVRARFGTEGAIGVCEYVERQLQHSCYRPKPITMIRLGIDTDYFRPFTGEEARQARAALLDEVPDDALVLGSVGGTDRDKGWLVLVEAVSRLDPAQRSRVRIVVAGDPPRQPLLDKVRDLGMVDHVLFPGLVSDVRPMLAACDIGFVLSFHEAGSYATCETLAMGLPAMVSNVGGLPELVRDGRDGWITRSGDVDGLVQQLERILDGQYDLPAMGESARQQALRMFSMQGFVRDTYDFYQRVTGGR